MTDILTIDFETEATADLKKTGAAAYAEHPDTRALCMGYVFNTETPAVWNPSLPFPTRVLWHVGCGYPVIAHNAAFEREIWNKVLPRQVPGFNASGGYVLTAEQTAQDTMIRAGYWGLPMKLEQVAEALGLPFGKDPAGHKAMMKVTKRKLGQEADPAVLAAVYRYCAMDVELERLIHNILPALPAAQVQEFILDAAMNDRGLQIDMWRVGMLKTLSDREMARLDALMHNHSGGAVKNTRALADLKKHLTSLGEKVTDLAKADVAELLKTVKHPMAKVLLALRQEAAKTSTAKLTSMTNAVCADGGVRGVFQFYGATRTGRYAGRLIQPQNYPRPHLKRDAIESELAEVEAGRKNGDLMLVSSALRSCIVAKKDHSLVVVDFAQIEARVLAWLANQNDILEVFANGEDVYTYDATAIGSSNRTLGKVCRLGLGYGMGAARFVETAKNYGLDLTEAFAQKTVKAWRSTNENIVGLWHEVERLVTSAVTSSKSKWLSVSTCDMRVGCFYHKASAAWVLLIELPSGRHLAYRHPEYTDEDGVSYEGQDQYTKQWTRIRSYGAKFVENIVQAVARDLMLEVMVAADEAGFEAVGTVHDEGLWEVPDYAAQQTLHDIESIITNLAARAAWAEGLPMKGEGFVAQRYGK